MAAVLIDDHLLGTVLTTGAPDQVLRARETRELWTTGIWYYRLCRAVSSPTIVGALSGPVAALPDSAKLAVIQTLITLPDDIGIISLRELAPTMAALGRDHRLNLLNLEALAAAKRLHARVHVASSNEGPLLRTALDAERLDMVVH